MSFIGEIAALLTSACWAFTGIFFTIGGRRVGSQTVNLTRLLLAFLIMLVIHRVALGKWLPLGASANNWGWLALSGVIGLTLGDAALFQALVFIGPRLASLLMALVPIISTILAWIFLGETLSPADLLAVLLTVGGVAWVVLERTGQSADSSAPKHFRLGVLLGLAAATGQSLGLLTSRFGLANNFPVVSANLIRILAGGAALWALGFINGSAWRAAGHLRQDRRAFWAIVGGTVVGPVIGIMASLVAVQHAPLGIASTLMSLTPIMMLPLVVVAFREQVSRRAIGGTVLALAGVSLIFLF